MKHVFKLLMLLLVGVVLTAVPLTSCSKDETPEDQTPQWVTLDKITHSMTEGETFTLVPDFSSTATAKLEYQWSSTDPTVASVSAKLDKSGFVTALAAGTTTIKIVCTTDSSIKSECALTVHADDKWVTLDKTSHTLTEGEDFTLTPTFGSTATSELQYDWTSSEPTIASVSVNPDKTATVTTLAAGTTTIKIQCKSDSSIKDECLLTVEVDDKWVTLDKTSHTLTEGDDFTLTPTFGSTATSELEFDWTSSVPAVASVSANADKSATITALTAGTTTIKIQCKTNAEIKAECDLTVDAAVSDGIVRILAIGNSYSQDAVEYYLYGLFEAAGIDVIIGNLYIGGCSLQTHYENSQSDATAYFYRKVVGGVKSEQSGYTLKQGLADEKWDYVTFQQKSGLSGQYATYSPYLQGLIDYVKANTTKSTMKMAFHQTWAYCSTYTDATAFSPYGYNQMTMYNGIMDATSQITTDYTDIDFVIPAGTAIQNGRASYVGDTYNHSDGTHLEVTYGRYTAACAWFETISGTSVVGNTYAPTTVDNARRIIGQNAAHFAVQSPFTINPMSSFQSPPAMTAPVYIDFGGTTANNTSPSPWNNISGINRPAGTPKVYLNDTNGNVCSVAVSTVTNMKETLTGVSTEPDKVITIDGIGYPKSAWMDGFVSGPSITGTVELTGFDPSATYDLNILCVRWEGTYMSGTDDVRRTQFTVVGSTTLPVKSVNPGISKKTAGATPTYEEWFDSWFQTYSMSDYGVKFESVAPDTDGKISISILGIGANAVKDAHLNAVVITKN